ncbi:MAG TPA: tetratricopeptide repeat protein [Burkholderiaceae bacterium]|jgi:predicted TPR repeat methyltransferase|nr:tetratricopeptide repeat protein [Burkholderiaceae bacterium]
MKIDDLDERNLKAGAGQGSGVDFYTETDIASPGFATRADLLERGLKHHEAGRLEQAQIMYRRIFDAQPLDADALHLFGVAEHQGGNHRSAIEYIERAIDLNPLVPLYHNNLGAAYQSLNLLDEAGRSVMASLALKPDSADAHYNLGVIFDNRGEHDRARACFRQAILLQPAFIQAHFNLGVLLRRAGDFSEAAHCFQQVVQLEPGNATARFLLAASNGQKIERAPDQYVAGIFDADADKFDEHLVNTLQYDTPQRLLALSIGLLGGEKKNLLDIGCGTGLVGASFAPYTQHLVGVDLSANMLARASSRQLYQRLEHAELLSMMQWEKSACYDIIVAADVFIYCGRLEEIFTEARRLLRDGGFFVFSVESLDDMPRGTPKRSGARNFQLNANGRFAHSAAYIHTLAFASGFRINTMLSAPARLEAGKPVSAWLVLLESEDDG